MNKHIKVLAPIVEKVGWTFVQAGIVALLAVGTLDWSATKAGIAAGVTAVITLGLSSVTAAAIPVGLPFYTDLGLRIARSSSAAFLAFLLVDPQAVLVGETWQGALGAAGMAVLVAIKGGGARFIGDKDSPATLPARSDPASVGDIGEDDDALNAPGELPDWARSVDVSDNG
jgi:hypothetical protein